MSQYFNLTLDTTAPSDGSINFSSTYYKQQGTASVIASAASYMKVWFDQKAQGDIADAPNTWSAYSNTVTTEFSEEGINYGHAVFMDEVGNISSIVNSSGVMYDTTAPTISNVLLASGIDYTSQTEISLAVTASDVTSGLASFTISSDSNVVEAGRSFSFDGLAASETKTITVNLTGSDGLKTVKVIVTDKAGNTSLTASDTINLETTPAEVTMTIKNADCTATLPGITGSTKYGVVLETAAPSIIGYKLWEGSAGDEPGEYTTWISEQVTKLEIKNLTFSSGDGIKNINAKVKERNGNIRTLTVQSRVLDTTAPTVSLSGDKTVISSQTGFNTVILTINAVDTHGLTNYQLYVDNVLLKEGVYADYQTTWTSSDIKAKSAGAGAKKLTARVQDEAGNWGTSNELTLTIDETAPTGIINGKQIFGNEPIKVTLSASDQGGAVMSQMKVWLDSETKAAEGYVAGEYVFTGSVADGDHVAHVQYIDSVGNTSESYNHSFRVDTVAPVVDTFSLDNAIDGYTKELSHTITINVSDPAPATGVNQMKIWGDFSGSSIGEPTEWENYTASKSITLTTGDGVKHIYGRFNDNAGNISQPVTITVYLDQESPTASIELRKVDDSAVLPAKVSVVDFAVRISSNDNYEAQGLQYKLSGDLTTPSADWTDYVETTDGYMLISNLQLTAAEAEKTIRVEFKDKAGNQSSAIAKVTYDKTAPVIDVSSLDYNIISKQTSERLNAQGIVIPGTNNDKITFKFSCGEKLLEYKVCVHENGQTAAGAVAIGITGGSQNMSGANVAANTEVNCVIRGVDFAATTAVNQTDGAYFVIVYGKDEGGTWSAVKPTV